MPLKNKLKRYSQNIPFSHLIFKPSITIYLFSNIKAVEIFVYLKQYFSKVKIKYQTSIFAGKENTSELVLLFEFYIFCIMLRKNLVIPIQVVLIQVIFFGSSYFGSSYLGSSYKGSLRQFLMLYRPEKFTNTKSFSLNQRPKKREFLILT